MKRLLTVLVALAISMAATIGTATAAPKTRVQTVATPAQAAAIITSYTGESFPALTRHLAHGHLAVPGFGDPFEQCAALEAGIDFGDGEVFQLTYPYTFYGDVATEMPPGWPLLTANNRRQCAIALYTYHHLAPYFFGEDA